MVDKRAYDRESLILVVDDDQTLLKFFKIHLNKFFSKVTVVKSAKEAIDSLKEKSFDLVLSDIKMPKVDGLQLLKKVRDFDASIPVLLVSGGLIDEDTQVEIDTLADGYLRKPFSVEEIQHILDSGLRKREILKELSSLVGSNENLKAVLSAKGKKSPIKAKSDQKRAVELLEALKKSA